MEKDNGQINQPEVIETETVIDEQAWEVITRLYSETFKELVER